MNLHTYDRLWSTEGRTIRVWIALVLLEVTLLLAYFGVTSAHPTDEIRYLVYPFIWINAGLWAVFRSDANYGSRPHRLLAVSIAGVYLVTILYLSGNVGPGVAEAPVDLRVEMYAPGWGPMLAFTSPWLRLFLLPFEVVGYASLAYLLYVNVLDLTRGVFSGALGLVTCIGCTAPILAPLIGFLGGPATSLTTTAYQWSYDIGTLVFLLTVGLLYWSNLRGSV
jgi:hypothetical protein